MTQLSLFEPIRIPLSGGHEALIAPIDADLLSLKWHTGTGGYAAHSTRHGSKCVKVLLHRVVLGRMIERPLIENEYCDHIDGNRLNNTRSNLRLCTIEQNAFNRGLSSANVSGFKGVSWNAECQQWQVYISVKYQTTFLGLYNDPIEAARAYDAAAIEHFGPYACTNAMLGLLPASTLLTDGAR